MEWQNKMNQQRTYFPQKSYPKTQPTKKALNNFAKPQNLGKSGKNYINAETNYSYQSKTTNVSVRPLRKTSSTYYAYAAPKAQGAEGIEQAGDLTRHFETLNYFIPQIGYRKPNQNGSVPNYSTVDKNSLISELSGFKIVQNGITIHDETDDEKAKQVENPSLITFTFEDKFTPFTESTFSLSPSSKDISLPNFIEAQE